MPGTVLNKLRLQKFIMDVAILLFREPKETETEREGERQRHRQTLPGQKLGSRGAGEGQTAYVGAPAPRCDSRRGEVKAEKRKGEGDAATGEAETEVLNIFVCL